MNMPFFLIYRLHLDIEKVDWQNHYFRVELPAHLQGVAHTRKQEGSSGRGRGLKGSHLYYSKGSVQPETEKNVCILAKPKLTKDGKAIRESLSTLLWLLL